MKPWYEFSGGGGGGGGGGHAGEGGVGDSRGSGGGGGGGGGGRRGGITTVFVDTRLSKSKHPRKRFQNFQSIIRRMFACQIPISHKRSRKFTGDK